MTLRLLPLLLLLLLPLLQVELRFGLGFAFGRFLGDIAVAVGWDDPVTAGNFRSVGRAEIEMLYACLTRKIPATAVGLLRVRARRWHESFRWGGACIQHFDFRFYNTLRV